MRAAFMALRKSVFFGCFHRDLGEKHHVIRKLGQARHQFETFGSQCVEFTRSRAVFF